MQNFVATGALALFPLFAAWLFIYFRFKTAVLLVVMTSQLFLPVGAFIKFEGIPQFDKVSIPAICLIIAYVLSGKFKLLPFKGFGVVEVLALMYLLGPMVTSELNGEALRFGPRFIPGVGLYDAISALVVAVFTATPFFVGRGLFNEEEDQRLILRFTVLSAVIYSIPLLFEVRFSPQLHVWLYGIFPGFFEQSVRSDGYRPMAFLGHGLVAAHFVLLAFLASMALWRTRTDVVTLSPRPPTLYRLISAYLAVMLYFCRTLGAGIYGIIFGPLILLSSPKVQTRIAAFLVFLSLLYPTLRYVDWIPTTSLVAMADTISRERADSLKFRFDNETMLLERAAQKPAFGWGRFGRNRVYDEDSGKELTITDGEWIITLGQFGAVGFIAQFGLLSIAVFRAALAVRYTRTPPEAIYLGALSLMAAVSIFDLLPNALLMPWTWLIIGALLGYSEQLLGRKTVAPKDLPELEGSRLALRA